jgi:allene oxide cyclase-like protein
VRTKINAALLGLALLGLLAGGITIASASQEAPATNAWGMPASSTAAESEAPAASPDITTAKTIVVISRNETTTDIDNPPAGLSQGDEGVVHSPLFNRAGAEVGTLDVHFVETSVDPFAIQAVFTASLAKGQITAQGVAGEGQAFTAAVTGGTGAFQNARGQVRVRFQANQVVFTYHLIP